MYILGVNAYHGGASACLLYKGEVIAAAEEERFKRIKYWAGFPSEAIEYCLQEAGISPYDVDHIGISRDPSANLHKKVLFALKRRPDFTFIKDRLSNMARVRNYKEAFSEALSISSKDLSAQFHHVEHHRAHMASAFFVSPYDEAAVISVDGMGDFVSTMWGVGKGNEIKVLGQVEFPHSLGLFYTALTQWLGFPKYGDEGKVMGLAPYGSPNYLDEMSQILRLQQNGTFELNLDYFVHHAEGVDMTWAAGAPHLGTLFSDKLAKLLGVPREPKEEISQHNKDIAASLQSMLEQAEFNLVNRLQEQTGMDTICMAGGVALNSSFNGKILPHTPFKDIYIQPAAGDAGTALGAAYYVYHQVLGNSRKYVMQHAYTGPGYSNEQIESVLQANSLSYEMLDEGKLIERASHIIANGDVLGWFQGRMEWGPRALGNRSILADPRRDNMRDILNARIKHREQFRPFAPSIHLDATSEFFDQSYPDPFMLKIYNVHHEKRAVIPAVTHVDGTGRLQTVERGTNPLYWSLIESFREKTNVPVVLNTSLNENEPIICKPQEAVDCFLRTKMDAMALGNYLLVKDA